MTEDQEARILLARIDERVKTIAHEMAEMRQMQCCESHTEQIKNLERIVYGLMAVTFGLIGRVVYDLLKG